MKPTVDRDKKRKMLGKGGEDMAVSLLEGRGMKILARNFRHGAKELDIVAAEYVERTRPAQSVEIFWQKSSPERRCNLHFVEVKTRQEPIEGQPWESVGPLKQRNLVYAARGYLRSEAFREAKLHYDEIFFDIVSIVWNREGTDYTIEYIADAFRPMFY